MFTEAGERWLVDYITLHPQVPEYGDMVGAMKYGIEALLDEIDRSVALCEKLGCPHEEHECLGRQIENLKRRFTDREAKL